MNSIKFQEVAPITVIPKKKLKCAKLSIMGNLYFHVFQNTKRKNSIITLNNDKKLTFISYILSFSLISQIK